MAHVRPTIVTGGSHFKNLCESNEVLFVGMQFFCCVVLGYTWDNYVIVKIMK